MTPHPSIDSHFVRTLREWRRVARKRLRERGWGGKPVPEDEIDRLADELLGRVFKPEWMEALRRSDEDRGNPPNECGTGAGAVAARCTYAHAGLGLTGSAQLCVFEQWCDPGCGAPTHLHAVEEMLTVLAGCTEVWVGEEYASLTAGQSVIVPAGYRHGFRNNGEMVLHVEATLAAPMFEAAFEDLHETERSWLPGEVAQP